MARSIIGAGFDDYVKNQIDSYNSLVYDSYTGFFTNLSKELLKKNQDVNVLPISRLQFDNKMNSNLQSLFKDFVYDAYLTCSFGTLSGLRDENLLEKDKLLYFNMTSSINIDNKILPLYHFYDSTELSDYAYRLFSFDAGYKQTLRSLIIDQRMLAGDLYNYLNDFTKLFGSIKISFNKLAPKDDPVRLIFNELNNEVQSRFSAIQKEITTSKIY